MKARLIIEVHQGIASGCYALNSADLEKLQGLVEVVVVDRDAGEIGSRMLGGFDISPINEADEETQEALKNLSP